MNVNELKAYHDEEHKLIMRILEIIEYSNLQDLRTINEFLLENGFVTSSETKKPQEEKKKDRILVVRENEDRRENIDRRQEGNRYERSDDESRN
jgi:hypothetical protein